MALYITDDVTVRAATIKHRCHWVTERNWVKVVPCALGDARGSHGIPELSCVLLGDRGRWLEGNNSELCHTPVGSQHLWQGVEEIGF